MKKDIILNKDEANFILYWILTLEQDLGRKYNSPVLERFKTKYTTNVVSNYMYGPLGDFMDPIKISSKDYVKISKLTGCNLSNKDQVISFKKYLKQEETTQKDNICYKINVLLNRCMIKRKSKEKIKTFGE